VGLSFEQPFEAFESIAIGTLNFLEAIRMLAHPCRFLMHEALNVLEAARIKLLLKALR
jgi:GDP-D-mannose dehydratase